ncbi:cyclin-domain-containing protein [Atractiella rhizophila]|nr:cyclin-domain-containing protein [Atractiella rhizophila]KAH8928187.1 cyclin-domain-containing protein [Atractiella rhizophila]
MKNASSSRDISESASVASIESRPISTEPLRHYRQTTLSHPPTPSTDRPPEPKRLYPSDTVLSASKKSIVSPQAHLCFHARNVPSISIEAYLIRILKYCPTTNEVFLSLLVYFDRMARLAAGGDPEKEVGDDVSISEKSSIGPAGDRVPFAIDSFNVHRLVIAGVTVASKFFSDVFYTNSRYAKVGGLPLHELNQLELQFLLLNDFNLMIPLDEMQRYADQLLVYWPGGMTVPPDEEEEEESSEEEADDDSRTALMQNGAKLGSRRSMDRASISATSTIASESEASTITPGNRTPAVSESGRNEDMKE